MELHRPPIPSIGQGTILQHNLSATIPYLSILHILVSTLPYYVDESLHSIFLSSSLLIHDGETEAVEKVFKLLLVVFPSSYCRVYT